MVFVISDTYGTPQENTKYFKYRYDFNAIVTSYEWDANQALGWNLNQDGFPYYFVVHPTGKLIMESGSLNEVDTALMQAGAEPTGIGDDPMPENATNPSENIVSSIGWSASAGSGASVVQAPTLSADVLSAEFNFPVSDAWVTMVGSLGFQLANYGYAKITYKSSHHIFFELDTDGPNAWDEFGTLLPPSDDWRTAYIDFQKMGVPYWNYFDTPIDGNYDTSGLSSIYFAMEELGPNPDTTTLEIQEIVLYE